VSTSRAFRFGVQAATPTSASLGMPATTSSEPRWSELARRAEDHGYDVLSVPDHLDGQFAPLVGLGYAAAMTERIRLATIVLANDLRNPVLLAQEADTLAMLSGLRFELGLGAGWKHEDYERAGVAFDRPSVRIERLARAIEVLRAEQRYRVPLMLGGGGRKMLALAAHAADIVSVVMENASGVALALDDGATLDAMRARVAWAREAAGTRWDDIELHTRLFSAADEPSAAGLSVDDAAASPVVLVRPARAMADKLMRLRDELGFSYFTVSERFTDEFARVITLLAKA
jgi:probable F420-dependent oxidoreductase